jgi:hypothetical protein
MSWTYRVRKKPISASEVAYGLAEVYDTANGAGCTERWMAPVSVMKPDDPLGDTKALAGLRRQLGAMIEALSKPILEDGDTYGRPAPCSIGGRRPEDRGH